MGTEIVNYQAAWAAQAQAEAQREPPSGAAFMSTRGGVLSLGDTPMPGNMVAVIVLDSVRENSFYGNQPFNEANPQPPVCYSFSRDNDPAVGPHISMASHPEYFVPQADTCGACRWNEWGSAERGRGKACQNRRRLALVPAGFYQARPRSRDFDLHLFEDAMQIANADTVYLRLPVTSVNEWAKYVQQLAASVQRPPAGVVTKIELVPDAKTQFKLTFEALTMVPDDMAAMVINRCEQERAIPFRGYEPPDRTAGGQAQSGLASYRR
ncbi:MAG: hypothetical protein ACP5RC_13565 [Halothiobacillaceae bacterium]